MVFCFSFDSYVDCILLSVFFYTAIGFSLDLVLMFVLVATLPLKDLGFLGLCVGMILGFLFFEGEGMGFGEI